MFCVYVLQVIGGSPGEFGYGYYVANILIFVIFQPALIVLFSYLASLDALQANKILLDWALLHTVSEELMLGAKPSSITDR